MAYLNLKSKQVSTHHTLFSKITLSPMFAQERLHPKARILAFDTIFHQKETRLCGEMTACRSGPDRDTNLAQHVFPESKDAIKDF